MENTTKKHAVIVLPTYNESENIQRILQVILSQQEKLANYTLSVLVVDDMSPDGTGKLVKYYSKLHPQVHLLTGKKQGLGVAYIRGFKYAMSRMHADVVFEMDADFSHDPSDIPRLLRTINAGADFVIGSRYIPGGSIPKEWSRLRVLNSKFGNLFARHIAGIGRIKDSTSGFRAIKTSFLKRINLNRLQVKGYSFQMNLLFEVVKKRAIVAEVPIHFQDRVFGKSKIKLSDILEFIFNAFTLRFPFIKFLPAIFIWVTLPALAIYFIDIVGLLSSKDLLIITIVLFSLLMTFQGIVNIYFMIYTWEDVNNIEENTTPSTYYLPRNSFTALIPARNEELVIQDTINAVSSIDYPLDLSEIIIICRADDVKTIEKVNGIINTLQKKNIKIITFNDYPINKPHALNIGLAEAKNEIVVVFDAEDRPHTNIYNIVNTIILRDEADIVQSGVQLMNFNSTWFSTLNVLEYFFWFKSTLHFFAKMKSIPLGGNTVFFKKNLLTKNSGWDEDCLTEDAEIGIRLSREGANIRVVYDEESVTREETPHDVKSFIKQRTRWNLGFMQIIMKSDWKSLPTFKQRFLALYVLIMPELQAVSFLFIPFSIFLMFTYKFPVIIALVSLIPALILFLQLIIYNIGFYEFTRVYKIKYPLLMPLKIILTFYPFQLLLGFSSFRAITRLFLGNHNWEKTLHINAHREITEPKPAY